MEKTYEQLVATQPMYLTVTEIAQDYGVAPAFINGVLLSDDVVYITESGLMLPYVVTSAKGYTRMFVEGKLRTLTWTRKGRLFLYDRLKRRGVLPLCESNRGSWTDRESAGSTD